ncbi:hypothetical protein EZS27_010883 [termite gut metagenome]|uniref:Uncharacterized protein n=1 Tax=termite gut metagenome TaxID=433724 RepID=A0A5J4S5D8_9ZZZZ
MNKKGIEGFIFSKHKNLLVYTTIYYDKKNNDIGGDEYSFFRTNPDNLFRWWLEHILDKEEITLYRVRFFNYSGCEMITPLEKIYIYEYNKYFKRYEFSYVDKSRLVREEYKRKINKYIINFETKKSFFETTYDVGTGLYSYNKTHLLDNKVILREDSLGENEIIIKNEIGEIRTDKKGTTIDIKNYKILL